jgi:hypothetical protein
MWKLEARVSEISTWTRGQYVSPATSLIRQRLALWHTPPTFQLSPSPMAFKLTPGVTAVTGMQLQN